MARSCRESGSRRGFGGDRGRSDTKGGAKRHRSKPCDELDVTAHTCNPSTQEAEAGGSRIYDQQGNGSGAQVLAVRARGPETTQVLSYQ